MKLYFATRSDARTKKGNGQVKDCKNNPSANNSRWAVDYGSKTSTKK